MIKRHIYVLPKNTEPTGTIISNIINNQREAQEAYTQLESYIGNNEPIMDREAPNDVLTRHDFGGYITRINAGYLVGNPVKYQADKGTDIEKITDAYKNQTIADLDSDLAEDCSTYGRAYENVYIDEDSQINSAKLDVFNTVVVYDTTFKHNKMFAINWSNQIDDNGKKIVNKYDLTLWTATDIQYFKLDGTSLVEDGTQEVQKHVFNDVPVNEYLNNKNLSADHENVLSLIDAYNILQSDRVLDREKLVDAILAFYGASFSDKERANLKNSRAIEMPEGSKAEYIVKNINEADADVLRQTLQADIHKFSMTPDFSDKQFGDSPSGVSLLYKLLAFEQNAKRKERYFEKGLMQRFKLYARFLSIKGGSSIEPKDIDTIFTRSLPKNDLETSTMINNLAGLVDNETLISNLSFIPDPDQAMLKLKEEQGNISNPDDISEA